MASDRSDPVAEGLDLRRGEDGDTGRVDTAFAWRDLVSGWNPLSNGRLAFPSLWDTTWRDEFTGTARLAPVR